MHAVIYAFMHADMYAYMHARMYHGVSVCMHACRYVGKYVCILYVCTLHACTYVRMYDLRVKVLWGLWGIRVDYSAIEPTARACSKRQHRRNGLRHRKRGHKGSGSVSVQSECTSNGCGRGSKQ